MCFLILACFYCKLSGSIHGILITQSALKHFVLRWTDYYAIIIWYYFRIRQDTVDFNWICYQSSVEYKYSNDFDTLRIVIDQVSFVPQSHIRSRVAQLMQARRVGPAVIASNTQTQASGQESIRCGDPVGRPYLCLHMRTKEIEQVDCNRSIYLHIYEADHFRDSPRMGAHDETSTCVHATIARCDVQLI